MTSLCNLRFYDEIRRAGLLLACLIGVSTLSLAQARADTIIPRPYQALVQELERVEGFEAWPRRTEPGHLLAAPHRGDGITVASHFEGQNPAILTLRNGARFDSLTQTAAQAPLKLETGPPAQGIAIALHDGFASNAAFPIGPAGFNRIEGRGEGMLAILFDHDQRATGLLIHSDYADPLGSRPAPRGTVEVILLDRMGRVLARPATPLAQGITALGYATADGAPLIAGLVVLNTDPGGIAVDDILYDRAAMLGGMPQSPRNRRAASWQTDDPAILSAHAWKTAQILPLHP